jgi:Uma2 family endonuclease
MAAAPHPLVSLYEYLHSDYQPDVDYVDGVLEERSLGEHNHADLQTELAVLFRNHRNEWKVKAVVEQRVQLSPTRYRVPDLCILPGTWKREPIVTAAPLLCIEILSSEDRLNRTLAKCSEYLALGTPEAWIFDPEQRAAYVLRPDGTMTTHREGLLQLRDTLITVDLPGIFAVLDEE